MTEILRETRWKDKNELVCIVKVVSNRNVFFMFEESEIECVLSHKDFLQKFVPYIAKVKKYYKRTLTDMYGGKVMVDKSAIYVSKIVKQLDDLIKESGLTYKEVADTLEWSEDKVRMILSGDSGLNIHELTHISGALGYAFDIVFKKHETEEM